MEVVIPTETMKPIEKKEYRITCYIKCTAEFVFTTLYKTVSLLKLNVLFSFHFDNLTLNFSYFSLLISCQMQDGKKNHFICDQQF